MHRGRFITLEGGEGVGKSTSLGAARAHLEAAGLAVVETREPGGTPIAERIRGLLLDDGARMPDDTELLLVFAARAAHLEEVIRPALARGDWVICDRFTDATYAYQGGGRGIDASRIAALEEWVHADLQPDLTILFDAPAETGLARARKRGGANRFETETLAFYQRVRETYLDRARAHPERFRVIDARPRQARVLEAVRDALDGLLDTP